MRKLLVAGLVLGAVIAGSGVVVALAANAATVPAYHPSKLTHLSDSRQVIVVSGNSRTSTYATAYAYQLGADGTWTAKYSGMPARIGYGGWVWASKRVQDTGTTPMGTFRITNTFGLKANPGTKMSYRFADGNDYWVGDNKDAKTYNMVEPFASSKRTWRTGEAERLKAYPTQYEYAAVVDFNRPAPSTIKWNATRSQHETSKPANTKIGNAIFLHINGAGSTAGCVSLSRANLLKVLKWLDPAQKPRIVMATQSDLGAA